MPIPNQNSLPIYPLAVAEKFYREHMGQDFIRLLDWYLLSSKADGRYLSSGPGYLLLFHEEDRSHPLADSSERTRPYWYLTYMGTTKPLDASLIRTFLKLMPYPLDRVGFSRYAKDQGKRMHFLKTDQLLRHYGIQA